LKNKRLLLWSNICFFKSGLFIELRVEFKSRQVILNGIFYSFIKKIISSGGAQKYFICLNRNEGDLKGIDFSATATFKSLQNYP